MLIVVTRDSSIMDWVNNPASGASAWGSIKQLSAGKQDGANKQLTDLLKTVKTDEPLCITGHGNNTEVGDEGSGASDWTWTADDLANSLGSLKEGYNGPVLMEVCAQSVTDFAAHLAISLQETRILNGVWIYGYNKAVDVTHTFPNPAKLSQNVEIYGKQVNY